MTARVTMNGSALHVRTGPTGQTFAPVISSEITSLLTLVSILLSFAVSMFNWKLLQECTSSDPGV